MPGPVTVRPVVWFEAYRDEREPACEDATTDDGEPYPTVAFRNPVVRS